MCAANASDVAASPHDAGGVHIQAPTPVTVTSEPGTAEHEGREPEHR